MMDKYIGLMSGTSMDAIDAVLVNFEAKLPRLLAHHSLPLPNDLRQELATLQQSGKDELNRTARLDIHMGRLFAQAVSELLQEAGCQAKEIIAIGSHGQTIRHIPNGDYPTSFQIGDPNLIAELTGITTVADFRRRDMAAGGQGAPLVPAFHDHVFRSEGINRVIVNIGGIANITLLSTDGSDVIGFDSGPGNVLMDLWYRLHQSGTIDEDGRWAESGVVHEPLLAAMLADPYFARPYPKSSGREYFHQTWLTQLLSGFELSAADVQATLCQLTAASILHAIQQTGRSYERILICGGGVHNLSLMRRLQQLVTPLPLGSTAEYGIHPDWVEGACFAWLAQQTLAARPANLPAVTGASHEVILGAIYQA